MLKYNKNVIIMQHLRKFIYLMTSLEIIVTIQISMIFHEKDKIIWRYEYVRGAERTPAVNADPMIISQG